MRWISILTAIATVALTGCGGGGHPEQTSPTRPAGLSTAQRDCERAARITQRIAREKAPPSGYVDEGGSDPGPACITVALAEAHPRDRPAAEALVRGVAVCPGARVIAAHCEPRRGGGWNCALGDSKGGSGTVGFGGDGSGRYPEIRTIC